MPRTRSTSARRAAAQRQEEAAWSIPSLREPRYSQSLERGLAILACFSPSRPVLGIADIADALGMSRSTTHRYVITLLALGYLEQGRSRKYRLGLKVTDLGMSAINATGLREHSHPHLDELRQQTGYDAALAVLDGDEVVIVDRARAYRRGQANGAAAEPGSRLAAHSTAAGKVLLAHLPESTRREALSGLTLTKAGPRSVKSKRALREQLEQIAAGGLALEDEELAAGARAIAAPVRNGSREVIAAASLTAPAAQISARELVSALGPHLVSAADRISARLGYRRDDEQP